MRSTSTKPSSIGKLPEQPGYYWYIPGVVLESRRAGDRAFVRPEGICEKRDGENFVRFTDGSRQPWANEHDEFHGPLKAPSAKWTLFWANGRRELVTGSTISEALTVAGYVLNPPALSFWVEGDDEGHVFDEDAGDWKSVQAGAAVEA